MKNKTLFIGLSLALSAFGFNSGLSAQTVASDTLQLAKSEPKSDRNVMLNASNSTGPRNVNIGLPAGAGGMTITENGLPVVYFAWPELPTKVWRMDAVLNPYKMGLLDLGQTAIQTGDVGFSLSTYDNLGTEKTQGSVSLKSNHYGLLHGSVGVSGALNKVGTLFSIGAYVNYDPGFFKPKFTNYYSDQTQIYKMGLTQKYKFNGGQGSIAALYKYADSRGMLMSHSPFIYKDKGKVKALDGIKIGGDSYFERSGKTVMLDPFTGEKSVKDVIDDFGTKSHTIDLIGDNKWNNGLNFNYTLRFHKAKTGLYFPVLTSVTPVAAGVDYLNPSGEKYQGEFVQSVAAMTASNIPITNWAGLFELSKATTSHHWKLALSEQYYKIKDYVRGASFYHQEVAANPSKLIMHMGGAPIPGIYDEYNNVASAYNVSLEYDNGWENKLALAFSDKWTVNKRLNLNYGARMEYLRVVGQYAPNAARYASNPSNNILDRIDKSKLEGFSHKDLNFAASLNGVYKITNNFGVLADFTYNELSPQIENYAGAYNPEAKKSHVLGAGGGVYFNHKYLSVVSKATYIAKDNYLTRIQLTNPDKTVNPIEQVDAIVNYEIATMGWTTDILATPFSNFNLHFLVTLQKPSYKKYSGDANFPSGTQQFNFKDNIVTGVSRFLLEIDPSYQWDKFKFWASARYFSKTYANLSNTLYFAGHWETFAGIDYRLNKHLNFGISVVNLLNTRGASGSIGGTDLFDQERADEVKGTVLSGSYIRPFTAEFSMTYRF